MAKKKKVYFETPAQENRKIICINKGLTIRFNVKSQKMISKKFVDGVMKYKYKVTYELYAIYNFKKIPIPNIVKESDLVYYVAKAYDFAYYNILKLIDKPFYHPNSKQWLCKGLPCKRPTKEIEI